MVKPMLDSLKVIDFGCISFPDAWKIQLELIKKRASDQIENCILLCEHPPVYTLGRSQKDEPAGKLPFAAYAIERGGKETYHGPGQLVLYPIVKLPGPNVVRFIRSLEHLLIDLLQDFQIVGTQREGETGVWVGNRKMASIGIAVKRWVTYHGAALNVNPELSHFNAIKPCGYSADVMTSMTKELGRAVTIDEVKESLLTRNPSWFVERNNEWINWEKLPTQS